ncbi:MAG: hypothetical protein P0S95_02555 [Rhabdochlamydiaceae bacterium]|nr:hypothetical protein [Candidatus Amphrikana amoebophyrae]
MNRYNILVLFAIIFQTTCQAYIHTESQIENETTILLSKLKIADDLWSKNELKLAYEMYKKAYDALPHSPLRKAINIKLALVKHDLGDDFEATLKFMESIPSSNSSADLRDILRSEKGNKYLLAFKAAAPKIKHEIFTNTPKQ